MRMTRRADVLTSLGRGLVLAATFGVQSVLAADADNGKRLALSALLPLSYRCPEPARGIGQFSAFRSHCEKVRVQRGNACLFYSRSAPPDEYDADAGGGGRHRSLYRYACEIANRSVANAVARNIGV